MSAIAVIYNLDGRPVEGRVMDRVLDSLAHRGTDGRNIWSGATISAGHLMRWTTPESLTEKLPLLSDESLAVITCDARIDNRRDLFSQLSFSGRPLNEIADSEIILAAYEKWGEDCPAKLIGDYVFAIWDPRENKLFAARDPLGVKHFYYYYRPGKFFAMASEIKALLEIPEIPSELNEELLGDFLVINAEDKVNTFYKGIHRLPATHALTVSGDGLVLREYWQPDPNEIRLKNDNEYLEAFREKFEEAVACRLRSAFPVGSMLSGGLDSSAVVCVASKKLQEEGRDPLHTFSAVFPSASKLDPRIDELRYMRSVINRSGCTAHFVNADDVNPLQGMDRIIWHADHPVGPLNVFMDTKIYEHAQKEGVRVLLSGTDGDSTVSYGFEDFEQFIRRGRMFRLVKEAFALRRNMPSRRNTLKGSIWHRGFKQVLPPVAFKGWRALRGRTQADYTARLIPHPLNHAVVNQSFRDRQYLAGRIQEFRSQSFPKDSSQAQHHWQALTRGLFADMLEQLEKISAAYEIEPRHPFFDRRLIEFCIGLPPGQRLSRGWTRSIFRHAMEGILPPDVQWRTDKANLGAFIKINLVKYGSQDLDAAINADSWKIGKYVDTRALQDAYIRFKSDPFYKDNEAMLILTTVYLLRWLEQNRFTPMASNSARAVLAV